jgi:hypothetical protein
MKEMNASEPLMTRRYPISFGVKTGGGSRTQESACGKPGYCAGGTRRKGGMTFIWASVRNYGNQSFQC